MKRFVPICAMILTCFTQVGFAATTYNQTVNGIQWTYTVSDGKASVGGGGISSTAVPTSTRGAITIPSELGGYPVTSIGERAFSHCRGMTKVTMPNTVTNIGSYAFYSCGKLANVILSENIKRIEYGTFSHCSALSSFILPYGVVSVETDAFRDCYNLSSIAIPDSVTSIGSYAFDMCTNLTSVTMHDNVVKIDGTAFQRTPFYDKQPDGPVILGSVLYKMKGPCPVTVSIPIGVKAVADSAFYGCKGLSNVVIPNGMASIGHSAFQNCSDLKNISLGSDVVNIEAYAFAGCSGLRNVTIPSNVTNISPLAFADCSGIQSFSVSDGNCYYTSMSGLLLTKDGKKLIRGSGVDVIIPDCVIEIGAFAFYGCSSLCNVSIPDSVASIGSSAFKGCASSIFDVDTIPGVIIVDGWVVDTQGTITDGMDCTRYGDLDLSRMRGVAAGVFDYCRNLTSVILPNDSTILQSGFYMCQSLTNIVIGSNVRIIQDEVFDWCTSLHSLTIPENVEEIGMFLDGWSLHSSWCDLYFIGNAPNLSDFAESHGGLCYSDESIRLFVKRDSTGWDVDIPGIWKNCRIDYMPEYTITMNGDGINSEEKKVYEINGVARLGPLSTLTRSGYRFLGWFTESEGGSSVSSDTVVRNDIIVYAHWVKTSKIGFDANGGVGGWSCEMDVGNELIPPTVSRAGYTFKGWSPEVAQTVPAENVTYTAQWEINKYSVTFDANGGEGGTNYVADYGTPIIIPQVSREGYIFKGWSPEVDQTVPDHDVVYVAQWDRISFSYRIVNGKAIILGSVDSTGESASLSGDVIIPSEIEGYPVIEIASRAFYGCSGLTGVTIPESVTSIGADAFNGCSGLMSMTIPENVTSIADRAFSGCTELTYITMPASVTRLGNAVFSQCRELTDVVLPDNITRIGYSLFSECSGLTNAVIPSKVIYIEEGAFKNCSALECVTIPSSVLSIGGSAFYGCTRLSDIIIPYGVSSIGDSAFYGCGELTSMVIPDSVMDIGYFAFKNCTNLASVQLPNKLATIKQELFSGCSALENIVIPDTVIEIGWGAFQDCASVADVIIPNSVTKIGGSAFRGCKSLQGITIPKPTTNIGAYAFAKCENLSNIEILSELTNIEDGLFSGCGNLTSVKLPNSLSRLGAYAFLSCNRLANINIPEAVKDIGEYAFYQCGNLQHIYFEGDAPVAQASSFINIPASCRLLVKSSSTGWGVAIPGVWNGCHLDYMKEYTVTLNGNYENSDIDSKTLYDNGMVVKIGELPSMTRNGFRFDGWFTEPEGGAKVAPDTIVSGDITVYAHWVKTCVVIFNANGGFFSDDNHQTYGVSATTLECGYGQTIDAPEVIRDKYDFAGWFTSAEGGEMFGEDCVVDTDNLTLYAHWQQRANTWYYDVVYRFGFEAEATITRYITDNQDVVIPSEFHNDYDMYYGYYEPITVTRIGNRAFEGCFYLESLTIPATVTRIGNFAFSDCFGLRIYFEGNAPSIGRFKSYEFCAYVRHETSGWPTEIPGTWMGASIDWRDQYVAFDANGGEGGVTNLLDRGTEIVAPTVTRTGYKFKGWEPAVASTVPNEDVAYTAQWEPIIVSAPVIATENGCDVFKTDLCRIVISSATEGAAIYYTDDGSTPRLQDEYLYTGPITITETTIFKAVAVLEGVKSAYATLTVTKKELKLEDALDVSDGVSVDTEETFPWKPVLDAEPKEGDSSARSAEIGDRASSWLSTTVSGAGIFSFWCKTSCEHDEDNTFSWDRLMVYTNNVEIAVWRMDGETDWMQRLIEFEGGENTVKWIYYKDRIGADGEDCAWVDSIAWRPLMTDATVEIGGGKYVVVPGEWLSEHQDYLCAKASDIDVALKSTSANGRLSIVECYLLGLDPEKTDDDFKITSFPMKADGSPDLEAITFSPPQSKWNISSAMPKLKGKAKLNDQWQDVPPGGNPSFRFFSIQVELP